MITRGKTRMSIELVVHVIEKYKKKKKKKNIYTKKWEFYVQMQGSWEGERIYNLKWILCWIHYSRWSKGGYRRRPAQDRLTNRSRLFVRLVNFIVIGSFDCYWGWSPQLLTLNCPLIKLCLWNTNIKVKGGQKFDFHYI